MHVKDEASMRALWEQGFYGKGNLSRSEPNWLKREEVRKGLKVVHVSEVLTVQRRAERAQAKWERARLEQEAILKIKLQEAQEAAAHAVGKLKETPMPIWTPSGPAPVGPQEILALPNSGADVLSTSEDADTSNATTPTGQGLFSSFFFVESAGGQSPQAKARGHRRNTSSTSGLSNVNLVSNGDVKVTPQSASSPMSSSDGVDVRTHGRRKSVRFSTNVESTTFELCDPPSPSRSTSSKTTRSPSNVNGNSETRAEPNSQSPNQKNTTPPPTIQPIVNKEHLQLMPEEALFLVFGFGVLEITDPASGKTMSTMELLTLFRQFSYFPPRNGPDDDLGPDDSFLVNYAVYHHFRSLGWVPRAGIKFGVDWLLYARGPVFDHAEFGLMVIPSYSDPWWKAAGKEAPKKTWQWMHSVVRVLSHVTKSLVLVYVDIPPPPKFEEALEVGVTEAMKLYKVREVMVKRWSSNRNR